MENTPNIEVPNLDAMSNEELGQLQEVYYMLSLYASCKISAKSYRENGQITKALANEKYCENVYKRLPMWARW